MLARALKIGVQGQLIWKGTRLQRRHGRSWRISGTPTILRVSSVDCHYVGKGIRSE
jgi:hypothetical protein